jgi:HK97 family phage major capsid protein
LKAWIYTSKIIKLSWELLQDSYFNLQEEISDIAGERLARAEARYLIIGTGSGQPEGILVGGTSAFTAASAVAITSNDVMRLTHSIDPAYRTSNKTRLIFNDNTLLALKQLPAATGENRPLWQPSITVGAPDKIHGYAYIIDSNMPDIATAAKPIAFGDFSKFIVRDVKQKTLVVFREKYADELCNAYMAYHRGDSRVINSSAIKFLTMA